VPTGPCATAHAREIASILNLGRRPHLGRRHADRIGRMGAERTSIGRLRLEARNLDLGLAALWPLCQLPVRLPVKVVAGSLG
jgi:hypothetical protein